MEKEKEIKIMNYLLQFEDFVFETKGGLDKWFKEKWVDISRTNPDGSHPPCGRSDASKGGYPKCRKIKVASKMSEKDKKNSAERKRRKERKNKSKGSRKPNYVK